MSQISVLILMGSDSDAPVMQAAVDVLRELEISCEMTVASAHRSPERVMRLVREAPGRGVKVYIVGAGAAAHLAGVVAAHTTAPVIGVPIDSSALKGLDALLSTVQMPPGVPVATVSIGKPGATNAGVLAAQILALGDPAIAGSPRALQDEARREGRTGRGAFGGNVATKFHRDGGAPSSCHDRRCFTRWTRWDDDHDERLARASSSCPSFHRAHRDKIVIAVKYSIVTFGCRVNQADSLRIEEDLRARGGEAVASSDADLVVVNTCSVTASADQGARQTIRRIARDNPSAQVVVTGCYATRAAGRSCRPPERRPRRRESREGLARRRRPRERFADGDGACGAPIEPGVAGRTAFTLRVQTGCEERCSYCIIPTTRGAGRSLPVDARAQRGRARGGRGLQGDRADGRAPGFVRPRPHAVELARRRSCGRSTRLAPT